MNGLQREGILSESDGKCLKQKLLLKAHIKSLQVLHREQSEDRKSRTNEFFFFDPRTNEFRTP